MAKLSASERQAQIVELLSNNGTMKAVELAEYFQVSRETIRRDLNALNDAGTIKKWFGGALPANDFSVRPVETRLQDHQDDKIAICEKALSYIPDNSVIYMDTGSTVLCLARLLKAKSGYTIITNSLPIVNLLAESGNQIIMTGGTINSQVMCSYGIQTISLLETIRVDVTVLGTSGFERHKGPTTNHFEDSQIKKAAIACAETNLVLSDSRKASYSSMIQYASWREIDYFITDKELSEGAQQQLSEMTTVIVAE